VFQSSPKTPTHLDACSFFFQCPRASLFPSFSYRSRKLAGGEDSRSARRDSRLAGERDREREAAGEGERERDFEYRGMTVVFGFFLSVVGYL